MITGTVVAARQIVISLVVRGANQAEVDVDAVVDTGYSDYLTLPPSMIQVLLLPHQGSVRAALADGSRVRLSIYVATIVWNGQDRLIKVLQTDSTPLIGMALLRDHRVTMDVVDGGLVTVEALP